MFTRQDMRLERIKWLKKIGLDYNSFKRMKDKEWHELIWGMKKSKLYAESTIACDCRKEPILKLWKEINK